MRRMTRARAIPDDVLARQREASDPAVSAWVVGQCRLGQDLRAGAARDPAAARRHRSGEDPLPHLHQGRRRQHGEAACSTRWRKWTALDDATLDAAIRAMSNERPDAALRALARRLFALALETPGGLKVQTIHAFCTRLLHQFPFEANVAARFAVLDDATQTAAPRPD